VNLLNTNARNMRPLHPLAWWAWAIGMAVAASRTTNPLLLTLLVAAAGVVVAARRPDAPWSRSFGFFLKFGLVIIAFRVGLQILFGAEIGRTILVALPQIGLPSWAAGVRIGGDLTAEALLMALYDGMRLAAIIACVGAANSLASPTRLLKSVPASLYAFGVSIVVATTFMPMLVADVQRVRTARSLRGRPMRGPRALAGAILPVLEGAIDRAITLAASMDSRGYGRRMSRRAPRLQAALLLGGLCCACIGSYAVIAQGTAGWLGIPMLLVGTLGCVVAAALAGHGSGRTRYRPDPWRGPEWLVVSAGLTAAVSFSALDNLLPLAMMPSTSPPTWPQLPFVALLAIGLAATPAVTSPPLPTVRQERTIRPAVPEPAAPLPARMTP